MNEFNHSAAAIWLAIILGYDTDLFYQAWMMWCGAGLLDIDSILYPYVSHGEFIHTLLGGTISVIIFSIPVWLFVRNKTNSKRDITFCSIFLTGFSGICLHLVLDTLTWAAEGQVTTHKYFWPLSHQQFHINTIWTTAPHSFRVFTEIFFAFLFGIPMAWRFLPFIPAPCKSNYLSNCDFEEDGASTDGLYCYNPKQLSIENFNFQCEKVYRNFLEIFRKPKGYMTLTSHELIIVSALVGIQSFVFVQQEISAIIIFTYYSLGLKDRLSAGIHFEKS